MCTDEGRRSEPVGDEQAERTRQRAGYFHGRGWALAAPTPARTVDHAFMGLDVDLDEGGFLGAVRRMGLPAACAGACVRRRVDLFAALLEPYQANRTLGVVSKMMNLAEAWGLRPDRSNPCYHIRKYKEGKRERFLTAEELARLGRALDEEESFAASAVTAFRLLLYTGARLSEIQTLKWEHIRGNRMHLPDSRTGAKTIPLNEPALEVLAEAKRVEGNPYVIAGTKDGAYLTGLQKPWRRVRKAAELEDVRMHDLRHSCASKASNQLALIHFFVLRLVPSSYSHTDSIYILTGHVAPGADISRYSRIASQSSVLP